MYGIANFITDRGLSPNYKEFLKINSKKVNNIVILHFKTFLERQYKFSDKNFC